ncbi:hypothetical protein [Nitrososphaera sp.]
MTTIDVSSLFEKARSTLQNEHDSMVQKIKEEVDTSKRKTLSKV